LKQTTTQGMTAQDLKKGSIVEITIDLSPEQLNQPVRVVVERCSEKIQANQKCTRSRSRVKTNKNGRF